MRVHNGIESFTFLLFSLCVCLCFVFVSLSFWWPPSKINSIFNVINKVFTFVLRINSNNEKDVTIRKPFASGSGFVVIFLFAFYALTWGEKLNRGKKTSFFSLFGWFWNTIATHDRMKATLKSIDHEKARQNTRATTTTATNHPSQQ